MPAQFPNFDEKNTPTSRVHWVDRVMRHIENGALVLLIGVIVLIALSQIGLRNLLGTGFLWADELQRILVLWVIVIGGVASARVDRHLRIDLLNRLLGSRWHVLMMMVVSAVVVIISSLFAFHSARFVVDVYRAGDLVLEKTPAWPFVLILPMGIGLIAAYYLRHFFRALVELISHFTVTPKR